MTQHHFGRRLRILYWCTDHTMSAALADMELTAAQGHIMLYLSHRQELPCFRDIEEEFRLSHPTVSGLLARLEKKGFIALISDKQDRRCKRVQLQEKGWQCIATMRSVIQENEERLVRGFTPEEQEQFSALLERAIINMDGHLCCRQEKERKKC